MTKLDDGGALEELKLAMRDVTDACLQHDGKGSVTLKLSIEPISKSQVKITDKVSFTRPSKKKLGNVFYADDQRRLSRDDPGQSTFDELEEAGSQS